MNSSNFRSGIFWGAVFGTIAGLMNAPRSGRETRQILKEKIDDTSRDVDDLRFKVNNLLTSVERLAGEGLSGAQETVTSVQRSIRHFQEESQPHIRRVKESVEVLQEDVQDSIQAIKENN